MNVNNAWEKLFEKYDIQNKIIQDGYYSISANEIKEFKEPRLMAKWDSSESLPQIFKKNKINILPDSRGTYILSDFKLYEKIPELVEHVTKMQKVEVPEYESIDVKNITSESNAINVLLLSNIIDDFLCADLTDNYVSTFNGRMGTGQFEYKVDRYRGTPLKVNVEGAQCEIDAGLENSNSVVIMEAKNVVYPDFHIRQLYYPYRLWKNRVKKPIRLVFSIYSNQIYRLFEYEFLDIENYSSIKLINEKNYSLQDTEISNQELWDTYLKTKVLTSDDMNLTETPFIQADSFERVISLLEILSNEEKTSEEIAEIMQFDIRQSGYYFNAGKYLSLFEKKTVEDELGNTIIKVFATRLGKDINKLNYKSRQLELVSLILQHKIFNVLFKETYNRGNLPDRNEVKRLMKEYNVCNEGVISRRSTSVISWIKWIMNLTNI